MQVEYLSLPIILFAYKSSLHLASPSRDPVRVLFPHWHLHSLFACKFRSARPLGDKLSHRAIACLSGLANSSLSPSRRHRQPWLPPVIIRHYNPNTHTRSSETWLLPSYSLARVSPLGSQLVWPLSSLSDSQLGLNRLSPYRIFRTLGLQSFPLHSCSRTNHVVRSLEINPKTDRDALHARVLGYTIIHAPSVQVTVGEVLLCRNDSDTLSILGGHIIQYFIRTCKSRSITWKNELNCPFSQET